MCAGLPAPHFSYVKNIDPGLPLFLFNYSDRKLYGVFEAASHGRLNINPNGWTTDGSDTPYAAQVRNAFRYHLATYCWFGDVIVRFLNLLAFC